MLLVLTVADIRAVGPGIWNGWKGQLMRTLYEQVSRLFRGEDVDRETPLADHPDLVARARRDGAAVEATIRAAGDLSQTTEIAVAAKDRTGLFADLAATLATLGADVTDARVATTEGLVLDVFQIQDGAGAPYGQAEPARLTRLVSALEAAATRDRPVHPPPPMVLPARRAVFDVRPVVMIDTQASEAATVIEVSGADRPGLLADLSRAFTDHELSIRSAHIAAFGERAVDSFYVVDRRNRKVTSSARLNKVRTALEEVLDRTPDTAAGRRPIKARASARDVSNLAAGVAP
jgi:[protein-PII] uridylyltransferase